MNDDCTLRGQLLVHQESAYAGSSSALVFGGLLLNILSWRAEAL